MATNAPCKPGHNDSIETLIALISKSAVALAITAVAIILPATPVFGNTTAYFAGFALRGAATSLKQRFPYSYAIASENVNGVNHLDAVLRQDLYQFHSSKFTLDLYGQGDLSHGQSTSVAFVLNRETVGHEQIGNIYKLYIQLSGSVLFFDFRGMKVEASYPASLEYIDAFRAPPTQHQIAHDVRKLYFGHASVNLLRQYLHELKQANPRTRVGNTLRLTSVQIAPGALAKFPPFLQSDSAEAKEYVAESFDKALVANQHVSVLPYAKDVAIGNKMALRFSNGTIYDLSIPRPDYDIHLTVNGFAKFPIQKTAFASSWVYAVYGHLKLFEPLSDDIYLNASFRDGVVKVVPANEDHFMSWPVYQDAMLTLFANVTKALSNPNSAWAQKASNNPAIHNQLLKVKDVLQSCR